MLNRKRIINPKRTFYTHRAVKINLRNQLNFTGRGVITELQQIEMDAEDYKQQYKNLGLW